MHLNVLLYGELLWNIPLLLGLSCLLIVYVVLIKHFSKIGIFQKQPLLFGISLVLLYIVIGSPLASVSHLSFSTHMLQMSILYFIIPPVCLLGIPSIFFQKIQKSSMVKAVRKLILSPLISLIAFAILFFLYHLPIALNAFSQNPIIHHGYLFILFLLSFRMWWPIATINRGKATKQDTVKHYAFISGLLLMPACSIFIINAFIDGIQNPFLNQITVGLCTPGSNNSFKLLPSPFNTKYDQVMAGILMLGMHKFSLMVTFRLGKRENSINQKI